MRLGKSFHGWFPLLVASLTAPVCGLFILAIGSMADIVMNSAQLMFSDIPLLNALIISVCALSIVFGLAFFVVVLSFCVIFMFMYAKAVYTAVMMTITRIRWESKITDEMLKDVGRSRLRHMSLFTWSLVKTLNDDILSLMGSCRITISNRVTGEHRTYRGVLRD